MYSEKKEATLVIKILQERYRKPFLDKSQTDFTKKQSISHLPFQTKYVYHFSYNGRMGNRFRAPDSQKIPPTPFNDQQINQNMKIKLTDQKNIVIKNL